MFYHIIVELKEKDSKEKNKIILERDIASREDLISNYITPYRNGDEINLAGHCLTKKDVHSLVIRESSQESSIIMSVFMGDPDYAIYTRESAVESDKYFTEITKLILKEVKGQLNSTQKFTTVNSSIDKKKVFVVHGQDGETKLKVARFLESIDLKPIMLGEQASGGMTIIEKLEEYSDVGFGIILYTPCTIATPQEEDTLPRAHQNVVLEHGYLLGKLKRKNVCALVKGSIETPDDVSGVAYIEFDGDNDGVWQSKLVKELNIAGYSIDTDATDDMGDTDNK